MEGKKEFKGTKGKFVIGKKAGTGEMCRIYKGELHGDMVADCYSFISGITQQEAEANAKLFAAAKDLLDFAIDMARRYENSPWISEYANKAISKALD